MFQWSSNRQGTSGYPGQRAAVIQGSIRPPEHSRAQHLDSYLNDAMLQRSTRRIPPGDSTYDTVFQTVKGDTLILRVIMQDTVPTMSLAGVQARHPWLEPGTMKVIGFAPLQSADRWKDSGLLLGKAVHQVVKEFQVRPPQVHKILDPNLNSIQKKKKSTAAPRTPAASREAPPDYAAVLNTPSMDMPAIPNQFDELKDMEREELDKLLENELDFQAFCNKLSTTQTLQTMSTSVVDDNAKAAEENLKHEDELKELHKKATELQKQLKESVRDFTAWEMKQDKLCRPPDHRKMVRELAKAKKEAFERSEELAEAWLENEAEGVEQFVSEFLEGRKLHHLRAAKLELLEQMKR